MSPQPPAAPPSLPPSSKEDSSDFADETPTVAPWADFIDIRSLSIPKSIVDVENRFNKNIIHFQINYLTIVICIFYLFLGFFLCVIPFDFSFFYVTSMACFVLFVNTPLELHVFGSIFIVHRSFCLGLMLVIAVLPFALQQAWVHMLVFFLISAAIVGLHALLIRAPDCEYDGLLFVEPSQIV